MKKVDLKKYLLAVTVGGSQIDFPVEPKFSNLGDILTQGFDLVSMLMLLGSVVAVTMIIVSGYTLITSTGDPEKIEKGQKTLTGAIIGLVVVLIAGLIIKFVLELVKYTP